MRLDLGARVESGTGLRVELSGWLWTDTLGEAVANRSWRWIRSDRRIVVIVSALVCTSHSGTGLLVLVSSQIRKNQHFTLRLGKAVSCRLLIGAHKVVFIPVDLLALGAAVSLRLTVGAFEVR
jgi:hypothetical protein